MGNPKETASDLQTRFLQYLHDERSIVAEAIQQGNAKAVEDRKRLRQIDREIEIIKGGAL